MGHAAQNKGSLSGSDTALHGSRFDFAFNRRAARGRVRPSSCSPAKGKGGSRRVSRELKHNDLQLFSRSCGEEQMKGGDRSKRMKFGLRAPLVLN